MESRAAPKGLPHYPALQITFLALSYCCSSMVYLYSCLSAVSLDKQLSIRENGFVVFLSLRDFYPWTSELEKYCLFSFSRLLSACWLPQSVYLHILASDLAIKKKKKKIQMLDVAKGKKTLFIVMYLERLAVSLAFIALCNALCKSNFSVCWDHAWCIFLKKL